MKKLFLLLSFLVSVCGFAQIENAIPKRPVPPRLVNDYTGTLTPEQSDALERKLVAYNDSTSSQIAIVIVESLGGYEANEFATALGRAWGVGGGEFNNGVVVLVSTGGGEGQRDAYIATGYGLEGAIPDITAKIITDNALIPNLKAGNYYRAFDAATDDLMKAAAGEYKAPKGYGKSKARGIGIGALIIFLVIIFIIIGSIGGRGGGGMASRRGWGDFTAGWLIGTLLSGGGGGGGGWSGGGGGGGWSGGGGGFGGFGGGGFGGGGAGGKW